MKADYIGGQYASGRTGVKRFKRIEPPNYTWGPHDVPPRGQKVFLTNPISLREVEEGQRMKYTDAEKLAEIEREIGMRRKVYGRKGHGVNEYSPQELYRIRIMEEIADELRERLPKGFL